MRRCTAESARNVAIPGLRRAPRRAARCRRGCAAGAARRPADRAARRLELLCRLHDQDAAGEAREHPAAHPLPHAAGLEPEALSDGGWNSAAPWRSGRKSWRRSCASSWGRCRGARSRRASRRAAPRGPRGSARRRAPPARREDAPGLLENGRGVLGGLEPVEKDQRSTVPVSSGQSVSSQRTETFGIPCGQAITPCGPGISATTRREVGEERSQERHGEAEARDGEALRVGPVLHDLIADGPSARRGRVGSGSRSF
jgi:hypothetical protein